MISLISPSSNSANSQLRALPAYQSLACWLSITPMNCSTPGHSFCRLRALLWLGIRFGVAAGAGAAGGDVCAKPASGNSVTASAATIMRCIG